MNEDNITASIHRLVDERIENGALVHVAWVATAILAEHPEIHGEDAVFYRDATFKLVSQLVKRAIGKFDEAQDTTPAQLLFPGFRHLCKAYSFKRNGVHVLVPVQNCTDEELNSRADEFDKQALGCKAHSRELHDFISARAEQSAAA